MRSQEEIEGFSSKRKRLGFKELSDTFEELCWSIGPASM
jgi:hypothetical protein